MDEATEHYHQILGTKRGASPEELKRAYRRLMKRCHPDVAPNDPRLKQEAEERAKEINEAYRRLWYDRGRQESRNNTRHSDPTPPRHAQRATPHESSPRYPFARSAAVVALFMALAHVNSSPLGDLLRRAEAMQRPSVVARMVGRIAVELLPVRLWARWKASLSFASPRRENP